ncbi:MAG: DUF1636 family protein [Rivularia sp. (in: cyanobacteria)]
MSLSPVKVNTHILTVNLPVQNIVLDLFQFSKLYRESKNGYVLPAKMPEQLKSNLLVRIPPVPG